MECTVCYDELAIELFITTGCNHSFCTNCFLHWLNDYTHCPLDRLELDLFIDYMRLFNLKQEFYKLRFRSCIRNINRKLIKYIRKTPVDLEYILNSIKARNRNSLFANFKNI